MMDFGFDHEAVVAGRVAKLIGAWEGWILKAGEELIQFFLNFSLGLLHFVLGVACRLEKFDTIAQLG